MSNCVSITAKPNKNKTFSGGASCSSVLLLDCGSSTDELSAGILPILCTPVPRLPFRIATSALFVLMQLFAVDVLPVSPNCALFDMFAFLFVNSDELDEETELGECPLQLDDDDDFTSFVVVFGSSSLAYLVIGIKELVISNVMHCQHFNKVALTFWMNLTF